jgi:hypothetical protein
MVRLRGKFLDNLKISFGVIEFSLLSRDGFASSEINGRKTINQITLNYKYFDIKV